MNFYKITNEMETHRGLQYRDGLVKDIKPFCPHGDCEKGGIYFSREHILCFLSYGVWLREVTLPEGEPVYKNPGEPQKWKAHRVILGKRKKTTTAVIRRLIKEGADPKACDSYALRWAAEKGHTEIVKLMIPVSDPKARDSEALRWAAENGHTEIVKLLRAVQ